MLTEPYIAAMLALHRFRKHNIRELRSYTRKHDIFKRGISFSQLFKGIPMSVTSETKICTFCRFDILLTIHNLFTGFDAK